MHLVLSITVTATVTGELALALVLGVIATVFCLCLRHQALAPDHRFECCHVVCAVYVQARRGGVPTHVRDGLVHGHKEHTKNTACMFDFLQRVRVCMYVV